MNEKKAKIFRFIVIFLIFTPILSLNYIIINLNNTNENYSKKVNNDNLKADPEIVVGESSESSYVIVTTNAIASNSKNLTDFVQYKESLGFTVYLITEDDYGSATGKQRIFNIRNWLINNYTKLSIEYVLLIGNPDPDDESNPSDPIGDLPMLMCWPRIGLGYPEQSATDYIYADLTGDLDVVP